MAINKVGSKGIVDCSVAAADFAPGTVTSVKLADDAVTNAKLSNSSITASGTSIALGASGTLNNAFIDWQSKVTSDGSTVTTMVAGRGYFVDNSSAAGIVKLPASASIGDIVVIKDYAGNFGTNNLTIQRNSHKIQGVENDGTIKTNRASLVLIYVDATKGWLYTDEHNVGDLQKNQFTSATGGTVTTSGDFKIHSFTGDGNFVVNQLGAGTGPSNVDYLVVAGGGSGGAFCGGGGGAGGHRTTFPSPGCNAGAFPIAAQTYPITVGAGGAAVGTTSPSGGSNSGSNSVFSTITSTGGGAGGDPANTPASSGKTGGSGGGGGGVTSGSPIAGAAGNTPPVSPSQGNAGGNGSVRSSPFPTNDEAGGGGGGIGGAGANASGATGGNGGNGAANSITGSSVTRAGGGGGGTADNPGGSGGPGGGGAGGDDPSAPGISGGNNTGSGGGGAGANAHPVMSGAGGKGIVIIRYKFQ